MTRRSCRRSPPIIRRRSFPSSAVFISHLLLLSLALIPSTTGLHRPSQQQQQQYQQQQRGAPSSEQSSMPPRSLSPTAATSGDDDLAYYHAARSSVPSRAVVDLDVDEQKKASKRARTSSDENGANTSDSSEGAAAAPDPLNDDGLMIETGRNFLSRTCPELLRILDARGGGSESSSGEHDDPRSTSDRLIKIGRNVAATLRRYGPTTSDGEDDDTAKIDASLRTLVAECSALAGALSPQPKHKVPKVRFGKTDLQMPIVTLGGMRLQQTWNRDPDPSKQVTSLDGIEKECQDNMILIIRHALANGVNHIETAKGYGTSELQYGEALRVLFEKGEVNREDLIIQTKGGITATMTPSEYREQFLGQLKRLQLDYVDLFSVHGLNTANHHHWLFEKTFPDDPRKLIDVVRELKAEGKIRHYGFSSHGPVEVIRKAIETDEFEYVNLHYHPFGSYTASGGGEFGGNLENVRLCKEKDMGVFIISPYDKGGRLYAPSNGLRDLTLPDLEPYAYASLWLWHHDLHDDEGAPVHTIVCGAARPSDLDQPIVAAASSRDDDAVRRREAASRRIDRALEGAVGADWAKSWHVGLPNCSTSETWTQVGNVVWLYNVLKAFGMLEFCRERYRPLQASVEKWDPTISNELNVERNVPAWWHWVPGGPYDPTKDYTRDLAACPPENRARVLEAMEFVHRWCRKEEGLGGEGGEAEEEDCVAVPVEWQTAYDMRPWTAYPERS